jgi:murein DD-endopeptidase MepM/ murein hydrolase activator NlpD
MSVLGGMNLGGSGQAKKIQLVTDLREEYNKLNQVLQKTKELSADIAANLKAGKGTGAFAVAGGGGPGVPQMPGAGSLGGFVQPPNRNQQAASEASSGMSFGGAVARALPYAVAGIGLAATMLPTNQQAIERNFTESRLNFMTNGGARRMISGAMQTGTGIEPEDAARAAMMGLSAGMLPGFGRNDSMSAAATFSNLAPGVGIQGGMSAAIALNQASSVNKLRMIGINVRGADGFMRKPEDIANDVWKQLTSAAGGRKITKDAIALSLQPGNALYSYLNQYFGESPELRMGIINAIMQKASGAELDLQSLKDSGLIPDIAQSEAKRNAAASDVIASTSDYQIQGIMEANTLLTTAAKNFNKHVDDFGYIIKQFSKIETLAGGGNNGLGGLMGGIGGLVLSGITSFLGALFGGGAGKGGAFKKFGLAAILATGATYAANKLFNTDMTDEEPGGGQGGGEGNEAMYTAVKPLSGSPRITSPYGEVRHLVFNGKKSPSYGRPHGGVDYGVATGTPVMAVKDGIVQPTGYDSDGFGNYVKVLHDDGYTSYYGHLSSKGVPEGASIKAGQVIGLSGNSGNSTGPHLHFEVRRGESKVDPLGYLSGAASLDASSASSVYSANSIEGVGVSGTSLFDMKSGTPLFAKSGGAGGSEIGGGSTHTNYGGVVVNINVPKGTAIDEKKLAREVKNILVNEDAIRMAVSR